MTVACTMNMYYASNSKTLALTLTLATSTCLYNRNMFSSTKQWPNFIKILQL
jgi:hypothetical protein